MEKAVFKAKHKEIDGVKVSVNPMPAVQGLQAQIKLIKMLGPALKSLKNIGDIEQDLPIGEIVGHLVDSLDQVDTMNFIRKLLAYAFINNDNIDSDDAFNQYFTQNYLLLYKIVVFVLEVNYGNFFGQGGIGTMISKIKKPSTVNNSKD